MKKKYLLTLSILTLLLVSCNDNESIKSELSDAEERREYYDLAMHIHDAGKQDINELIELIYINRISENITSEIEYRNYLKEALIVLQLKHEQFNETLKLNGELSDETLYVLDEITYGMETQSVANLLSEQYGIIPPSNFVEIHNVVTKLFQEHFRYFMLNYHYNMSKGNKVFKESITESNEIIKKLNALNKEKFKLILSEEKTALHSSGSLSLDELEEESLYSFKVGSKEGLFKLFIHADNQNVYTQKEGWAGAAAGDQIHTGNYQIHIVKDGESYSNDTYKLGSMTFNTNRESAYKISNSIQDILVLSKPEASVADSNRLFFIKSGRISSIKMEGANSRWFMFFRKGIKIFEENIVQLAHYDNSEGVWSIETYDFNNDDGYLMYTGEVRIDDNTAKKWWSDPKYIQRN